MFGDVWDMIMAYLPIWEIDAICAVWKIRIRHAIVLIVLTISKHAQMMVYYGLLCFTDAYPHICDDSQSSPNG